ncbi:hypothetical protein T265_10912, partial [Opisthorchis viverrini]
DTPMYLGIRRIDVLGNPNAELGEQTNNQAAHPSHLYSTTLL